MFEKVTDTVLVGSSLLALVYGLLQAAGVVS